MSVYTTDSINVMMGTFSVPYNNWLPYASGCLISYARDKLKDNSFYFMDPLFKPLAKDSIEKTFENINVLGLTNYVWNESLNHFHTEVFKRVNPNGIVIWGGPNIPRGEKARHLIQEKYPLVDTFVCGQGEEVFVELLREIKSSLVKNKKPILEKYIVSRQSLIPKEQVVNPYLDDTFLQILKKEKELKASFETNRGCPYSCSFCDWGGQSSAKIEMYPEAMIHETIDYLFGFESLNEVEILDANFGILPRDLKIIEEMIKKKEKYKHSPKISYSGLAKNGSKHLDRILSLLNENFEMNKRHLKLSFQSHDKSVLDIAGRNNINTDKLLNVLNLGKKNGYEICSEMIIGLPGETASTWAKTLELDIKLGIHLTRAYILSVSENTLLNQSEYQEKYSIKTKEVFFPDYRISKSKNRNENELVKHHVISSCFSYDILELKKIYQYWWFHHNFHNSSLLSRTLSSLVKSGFKYQDVIDEFLVDALEADVFSSLIQQINLFVQIYFSDEDGTFIDNYSYYKFSSGALRFNDLEQIVENQEIVKMFLKQFFSRLKFKNQEILTCLELDLNSWVNQGFDKCLNNIEAKAGGANVATRS